MTLTTDAKAISISELNFKVKALLETASVLQDIWIKGQISNLKYYAKGGQYYFNVSDDGASVNCVMYASTLQYMSFEPKNDQQVYIRGKVIVFQKRGQLMFQVAYMTEDGLGDQAKQLAELKQQLNKEGLFDESHKKALPEFPKRIGIITALDSAAMWDFISTFRRYSRYSQLLIIPAVMQGAQSALSIIEALDFASQSDIDLVVITRGGGSAQDLASFNDEGLLRALYRCNIPSITGLGHEIDHSLLDLIADKSASTPTACAEKVAEAVHRLHSSIQLGLQSLERQVQELIHRHIDDVVDNLDYSQSVIEQTLKDRRSQLELLNNTLFYNNPLNPLKKGYAVLEKNKSRLKSVKTVAENDIIKAQLLDGCIEATVKEITHDKKK